MPQSHSLCMHAHTHARTRMQVASALGPCPHRCYARNHSVAFHTLLTLLSRELLSSSASRSNTDLLRDRFPRFGPQSVLRDIYTYTSMRSLILPGSLDKRTEGYARQSLDMAAPWNCSTLLLLQPRQSFRMPISPVHFPTTIAIRRSRGSR